LRTVLQATAGARGGALRKRSAAAVVRLALVALLCLLAAAGCGGASGPTPEEVKLSLEEAAVRFLDACMKPDPQAVLEMLTSGYKEDNAVPESLTREELLRVEGTFVGYSFDPSEDILLQDSGRHLVTAELDYAVWGKRVETLVLVDEGGWRIDGFTAFNWEALGEGGELPGAEAEKKLRAFLDACLDGNTDYVFKNLTEDYKREYRLERPWTAAEFSGIFGKARGYQLDPAGVRITKEGEAEADVTITFGSHGNLEDQTSRVVLLRQGGTWKVDAFPFFIY